MLLFGVGDEPPHDGIRGGVELSFGRPRYRSTAETADLANSPIHRPRGDTGLPEQNSVKSDDELAGQAAVGLLLQRKSVSSTHMRCRITASRRATATAARRMPRRSATRRPHAFSQDHLEPPRVSSD